MDKAQFNEWLHKHQKAFPAVADWFANLPDQKGTLAIWFDAMRWIDKGHADEATMRMVIGTEPFVRYANWHDTPRFVAEHAHCLKRATKPARTYTLREVNGVDTYRCHQCRDTGIIEIFSGGHVKAIRSATFNGFSVHRSAAACSCDASKRYAGMIESGALRPFNAQADIKVPSDRRACCADSVDSDIETILAGVPGGPVSLDEWASFA